MSREHQSAPISISLSPASRVLKRRRMRRAALLVIAAAPAAMMLSSQIASATTDTWTGAGTSWGTTGNWTGGNPIPQTGDGLIFGGTTGLNSDDNLGNNFQIASLQFSTGAGAFVLTSDAGANDQALALTGALTDNAAGVTTAQTINFAVNGTSASSLVFGSDGSGGDNLTLGASDTFGSMTVSSNSTTADTLNIGSSTLSLSGAVAIGAKPTTTANTTTTFNVVGSGTWNVTSTTNTNFSVGQGSGVNADGNATTSMDMSGLANFVFSTGTGTFGVGGFETRPASTLKMANTSNTITAANVIVGNSDQQTGGDNNNNLSPTVENILDLGAGTNVISTNTIGIGNYKAAGIVQYLTTTGSVTIQGEAGGTSTAAITIGSCTAGSAPILGSSLLLANNNASAANVQAGAVVVGFGSGVTGSTSSTGVVTFDTGTFNAASLQLATVTGSATYGTMAGGATGTFTLGTNSSSTGVLNVTGPFTLAGDTDTSSTDGGTVNGTFTINGGTANLNSNIAITTTAASAHSNTVATVNLNGGTLNMNGNAIGNAIPAGATGTVTVNMPTGSQVATIENLGGNGIYSSAGASATTSGVVMGGTGTLILAGNNTYTGPTTISAGTLQIGSGTLGGSIPSLSTVTNNSILSFGGSLPISISNNITGSGSVVQSGTGTTTLSGTNGYGGGTTISSGALAVIGSLTGTVNITGGALAGTGSVGGVTLNSGGAIHPGATAADLNVGTLAVNSLSVSGGDMRFDLGGSSSDFINDSGAASFTGGTVSLALDSPPSVSSYTVLTATGGISGMPTLTTTSIGRTTFSLSTVGDSLVVHIGGGPANLIWGKLPAAPGDGTTWDNTQTDKNWVNTSGNVADTFYDADIVSFTDSNNGHNSVNITTQVSPGSVTFTNSTQNYTFTGSGGIAGTTGLLMSGSGSVTLETANTYAGPTNVNAGTLILSTGGSIASPSFNIGGGIVNINSGGSSSSTSLAVNSGALNINSGGSLTAAGVNVTVAGGASMTVASGGSVPATTNLTDNGTATFSNATTTLGTLTGTGNVLLNGSTLMMGSGATVSASLQNGASPGSLTAPVGTLILTGANTYTGATTIPIGALLQIGNGGTTGSLSNSTSITDNGSLSYDLNITPTPTIAPTVADAGSVIFNSPGALNANITNITGAGSIQQTGAGTTAVSGTFTGFTGKFSVGAGTLEFNYATPTTIPNPITASTAGTGAIANVGKLTLSGAEALGTNVITYNVTPVAGTMPDGVAADVEITGNISTTNTLGLIKTGTGTLALSGTVDNAALGATVNQGTLLLNKVSSTTVHAIGGSGLNINSGGVVQFAASMGPNEIYDSGGIVAINDGGTLDLNGQNEKIDSLTIGSSTLGGTLTNSVPGTNPVLIVGTAVGGTDDASLSAVPPTTLTAAIGTLKLGGAGIVSAAAGSSITIEADGTGGAGGNHTLTAAGPGTVYLTGVADNSSVNVAVTGGTLVLAKPSSSATVHATSTVTGVSLGATLQLGGGGSDSAFIGGDQIYNGFAAAVGATQGDYGVFNMNGTFDLNGLSESFDKLTGSGNVINSQSGVTSTLLLGTNSGLGPTPSDFTGAITGNISLYKFTGTATTTNPVIISGPNTYTGGTSILAGILQVGDEGVAGGNGGINGTLGNGPIDDEDTLNFDRSDNALVISTGITGAGQVFQIGTGTTTLSGQNTYNGNTTVSAGTLTLADTGTIATDANDFVSVAQGATANINGLFTAQPPVTVNGKLTFGTPDANNHTPGTTLVQTVTSLTLGLNADNSAGTVSMGTGTDHLVLDITGDGSTTGLVFAGSTNAWSGKLDLGGNDGLIVSNGSLADITNQLKEGFNARAGYWNGAAGIISSAAASDTRYLTTLGVRQGGVPLDGVSTLSTDVLVKYTYYGDANLDGVVNGADYQQIDAGFAMHLTGWQNGDFNYDGVVDGSDYSLIDNTFNQINASHASSLAIIAGASDLIAGPASTSAVPEPASLGIFAMAAGLLARRRRKIC